MDIVITVTGPAIGNDRTAELTRELLKDVRVDADPRAQLVKEGAEPGSRGDFVALGQIALALVSGGALTKFIVAAFGFLGLHRKVEIEVQNAKGKKLKLKWDYINENGEKRAMALVEAFLKTDA
jgi:hypothetical protein